MRVKGHKLTIRGSGERGAERSSTGECLCGWTESHSTQLGVRQEYHWHLEDVRKRSKTPQSNDTVQGEG